MYCGGNLLVSAAHDGSIIGLEYAIMMGCNIHYKDDMALEYAVSRGHIEAAQWLLNHGANVYARNRKILEYAVRSKKNNMVRLLLGYGAIVTYDAVFAAASEGLDCIVEILNNTYKINQAILDGKLVKAVNDGDVCQIQQLIDAGANIHAKDDRAIQDAVLSDRMYIVQLLLDNGADILADMLVIWAVQGNNEEMVRFLIKQGADIHESNDAALKEAIDLEYADMVELLLKLGADPNADNGEPLKMAVKYRLTPIVKILHDAGAKSGAVDEVMLQILKENGDKEILTILQKEDKRIDKIGNKHSKY